MKLKLAALVAGALLATGANAQFDLGYDLGSVKYDLHDGTAKNRASNNVKVGFTDERNGLGAEASYAYTPKAKFGTGANRFDQSAIGTKVMAKAELPIAGQFSGVAKAGMGYERNQIDYKSNLQSLKTKEYFPAYAVGVNYKATDNVKVGVSMNHDNRDGFKFRENTFVSAGISYAFDGSKLA